MLNGNIDWQHAAHQSVRVGIADPFAPLEWLRSDGHSGTIRLFSEVDNLECHASVMRIVMNRGHNVTR
jgi:hypothetical protein